MVRRALCARDTERPKLPAFDVRHGPGSATTLPESRPKVSPSGQARFLYTDTCSIFVPVSI
jgi:hypothetical protein